MKLRQVRVGRGLLWRLKRQVDRLESMNMEQYMLYITDTRRYLWRNFTAGIARGLGGAVGFTILGAIVAAVLSRLTLENVPLIGGFLAEIVDAVQQDLGKR